MNHAPLAAEAKSLRHEIRSLVAELLPDERARSAWRDTPGDVGTQITAEAERSRGSLADVAAAAGARLTQSLRSLEEVAKTIDPRLAGELEARRYRAYELDRRLRALLPAGECPQWRVCVLLSEHLCPGGDWRRVARACMQGGADCLQLREKNLPPRELLERARELVALARTHAEQHRSPRPAVVINDAIDIALLAGADGVHLGQTDLHPRDARRLAGTSLIIGVSTHSVEEARRALDDGADVIGIGAMFPTGTKPDPLVRGPDLVREILADPALARLPHLAIGGITAENAGSVISAGARGVAVSRAVCAAADPERACRTLRSLFAA